MTPPSERELREWRSLRSLAQPGPETLRTIYSVAFPTLLDEFDRLTKALADATEQRDYFRSRSLALEADRRQFLLDHGIDLGKMPEAYPEPEGTK